MTFGPLGDHFLIVNYDKCMISYYVIQYTGYNKLFEFLKIIINDE